jgi:hypothetical protein
MEGIVPGNNLADRLNNPTARENIRLGKYNG